MTDSSKLCISCGLCCDGTLIGHVQLGNEDLSAVKAVMEIEDENGNGFFLQPCKKYCNGCTIYSQRPDPCISFKCGLLNSFEAKELNFDTAAELILEVKHQKIAIEKKLEVLQLNFQSPSFYFKMVELKKLLLKNESSLTQVQVELMSDLEQLNTLVEKHFDVTLY
jgi:Fe-S-cluster containining protein